MSGRLCGKRRVWFSLAVSAGEKVPLFTVEDLEHGIAMKPPNTGTGTRVGIFQSKEQHGQHTPRVPQNVQVAP